MKTTVFKFILICLFAAGCSGKPKAFTPAFESSDAVSAPKPSTGLTAEKVVMDSVAAFDGLRDYTALIHKEERLGNGPLRPKETIFMKFRKPNRIYMKWVKEPNKGMELIYPVKGGKLVVEAGGLVDLITPRLYLNPDDKLAMRNNRHPVTEADMGYLIRQYARDFSRSVEKKEAQIAFENPSETDGRPAHRIETLLPSGPQSGYYCYRSVLYFDAETKLPLLAEFYDRENKLFERYRFTQVRLNPGLTDKDFDEQNPEYDF